MLTEQQVHDHGKALQEFIRAHSSGGCRMPSEGDACLCPLCRVAQLMEHIHELQRTVQLSSEALQKSVNNTETALNGCRELRRACLEAMVRCPDLNISARAAELLKKHF